MKMVEEKPNTIKKGKIENDMEKNLTYERTWNTKHKNMKWLPERARMSGPEKHTTKKAGGNKLHQNPFTPPYPMRRWPMPMMGVSSSAFCWACASFFFSSTQVSSVEISLLAYSSRNRGFGYLARLLADDINHKWHCKIHQIGSPAQLKNNIRLHEIRAATN